MNTQELFETARSRALAPLPGVQDFTVEQRGRIQGQFEWLEGEVHRLMDAADRKWQSELEILLAIKYKDCIAELEAKHKEELRIREEEFKSKIEEVRYLCQEELQDCIDNLTEELAACREDSAADRQTIQHLVAVVAKLVK